jgi:hypothetical protein
MTKKNKSDLRFLVKGDDGRHSSTWRLWVTDEGDLYFALREHGGISKISFHKSGICRRAFTQQYHSSSTQDRAMSKWNLPEIPKIGIFKSAPIIIFTFPTNYLSSLNPKIKQPTFCIPPAPEGMTATVLFALTRDYGLKDMHSGEYDDGGLMHWTHLHDGIFLVGYWFHEATEIGDISSPGENGGQTLRFIHPEDKYPNRPITLTTFHGPSDGGYLLIVERGGCVED